LRLSADRCRSNKRSFAAPAPLSATRRHSRMIGLSIQCDKETMATVKIVTDSSSDIPCEIAKALDIAVVPMNVHFGPQSYLEGVSISTDEFYTRMVREAPAILPKTSQPAPGTFLETYKRAAEDCRDIISIHVSAALSGTYNSALT